MRVIQCIWRMHVGGTEGQVIRLASAIERRDIDLHLVTAVPGEYDSMVTWDAYRIAPWFKYDVSPVLRLISLFRRLRPDVIQTFLTQMDIVAGTAASLLRIPWILSERSTAAAYPPMLRHRIRESVGRRAAAIVANSQGGADYWRRVAPRLERIHVIPNIIPRSEIDAACPVDAPDLGEVLFSVGRFSAEKNLFTLLDALAPLLRQRKATAVFAGDGLLKPDVERKARELGIADRTRFLGNVANVWEWMKRASVLVAVSTFEGNPNAVLEAAAAGTPLVLSDIPAHRALFDDRAAWFVDRSSPQSIGAAIEQILTSPNEAAARSSRAREAIGSRSDDEIAAQYEQVYRQVTAERRT